jgi:hypothetical protein
VAGHVEDLWREGRGPSSLAPSKKKEAVRVGSFLLQADGRGDGLPILRGKRRTRRLVGDQVRSLVVRAHRSDLTIRCYCVFAGSVRWEPSTSVSPLGPDDKH